MNVVTSFPPRSRVLVRCGVSALVGTIILTTAGVVPPGLRGGESAAADLSALARQFQDVHRFSTLFSAQDVRDRLATDAGIDRAIEWCGQTAVTHVYVEVFRDGYQAQRPTLEHARDRFRAAGLIVSGCVTTTKVGKPSTGWKDTIACYTDGATQGKLQAIFEYAAALFDEIMIDDFWFTDCACPECDSARAAKVVKIGDRSFAVRGDSWEDYRCELMVQLSRERVLAAAKKVNPKATLIIKYPQWFDRFHERGYEVLRETADFDRIWVGTETRDYEDRRWGGTVQYEAYFIMRWLGGIGGAKCGGGWYDWLGTTERTYVEQARQTILAGARESFLFCYGGLQRDTGPKNIEVLRANIPELFEVARRVRDLGVLGLAAYKPANSHPQAEARVFDFVGMLGLPLVPCHEFPTNAPGAFFSVHALKDAGFAGKLAAFLAAGKPALITDGLVKKLPPELVSDRKNLQVLAVNGDPKSLLRLTQGDLDRLREPLLAPLQTTLRAPNKTALYLFAPHGWVLENFNDEPIEAELNDKRLTVPARGWVQAW